MKINLAAQYVYHHLGVPVTQRLEGMTYIEKYKMWITKYKDSSFRVQYHLFEEGCLIHPLIKSRPHIALQVPNLLEAIAGKNVILEPYEPLPGFKVAFIESEGSPIELIETNLTDEEVGSLE